jgi:hypothetical protein
MAPRSADETEGSSDPVPAIRFGLTGSPRLADRVFGVGSRLGDDIGGDAPETSWSEPGLVKWSAPAVPTTSVTPTAATPTMTDVPRGGFVSLLNRR